MSRVRIVAIIASSMMLFACSKSGKGGAGSPDDFEGSGNIPLAEAGKELKDVMFDFDSAALSSSSQATLRENARWLNNNAGRNVMIEGHCDERGTTEYNMALGLRRAEATKEYLRTLGVAGKQLSTVSYGEELPLDPGHTESAWSKNRRAHFAVQ